jgi:hypothetical protein
MTKPQYSSLRAVEGYLTRDQIFLLLTASDTGEIQGTAPPETPEWLFVECHNLGLITPGERPGVWKLTPDGWDARVALLTE